MERFGILCGKGGQLADGGVLLEYHLTVAVGKYFQRVSLADSHGSSYFLRDNDASEVVDPSYNSGCFHNYIKTPCLALLRSGDSRIMR